MTNPCRGARRAVLYAVKMVRGLISGGTMRRSGLWLAGVVGLVRAGGGAAAMGQPMPAQTSAPVAAPAAAQPGGRISGGMAWPSNLPAPMPLWPNGTPGALGSSEEDTPTIAAFIPASNPTKTAVVIAPGGGYVQLSMVKEGSDVRSEERRVG